MAQYQLTQGDRNIIQHMPNGSTRSIPRSEDNHDYLVFLEWDAIAGNDPDPADPPPAPNPIEVEDLETLQGLGQLYQNLIDGLNAIEATKVALDADATALSTITVANLAAVQTVLRKLGADLLVMNTNIDKLARGSETVLVTLRALKRNLGR